MDQKSHCIQDYDILIRQNILILGFILHHYEKRYFKNYAQRSFGIIVMTVHQLPIISHHLFFYYGMMTRYQNANINCIILIIFI